ncbi:hypothetical protein [Noviherbaspirillum pedocola]|uniref:Uncharacterized protein n=1 Tax=Noviherbaspirillum pedocola TaxID=2801341 RepID=A0A934SZ48_9BURK|nr:hypothetical protein [Noviherbaspirillum pedocola]MBK4739200.1 hypothetical protein [Noviherbaspirillum pedocola]
MQALKQLTIKKIRELPPEMAGGPWTVVEVERGFNARCGDYVLYSVNSHKPRLFRSLDTAFRNLRDELGVKEFRVEAKN